MGFMRAISYERRPMMSRSRFCVMMAEASEPSTMHSRAVLWISLSCASSCGRRRLMATDSDPELRCDVGHHALHEAEDHDVLAVTVDDLTALRGGQNAPKHRVGASRRGDDNAVTGVGGLRRHRLAPTRRRNGEIRNAGRSRED